MQIPAQKCCKEHGKWTEHAANCCKYRGKYNGKWEVRTQNRCTYRGSGSFQLQNAANSMENGENRKSKKIPQLKKKNPQTISYPLFYGCLQGTPFFAFWIFSMHIQMYPDLSTLQSQIFRSGRVVLFQQRRLDWVSWHYRADHNSLAFCDVLKSGWVFASPGFPPSCGMRSFVYVRRLRCLSCLKCRPSARTKRTERTGKVPTIQLWWAPGRWLCAWGDSRPPWEGGVYRSKRGAALKDRNLSS